MRIASCYRGIAGRGSFAARCLVIGTLAVLAGGGASCQRQPDKTLVERELRKFIAENPPGGEPKNRVEVLSVVVSKISVADSVATAEVTVSGRILRDDQDAQSYTSSSTCVFKKRNSEWTLESVSGSTRVAPLEAKAIPVVSNPEKSEEHQRPPEQNDSFTLHTPNGGRFGEWIRTAMLDIQINIVAENGLESPQIEFRNRFPIGMIALMPCAFRLEYQDGKVVQGTESCDGNGIVVGKQMGGPLTTLKFKSAPARGILKRVDLVYGLRGKIAEKDWVRFVATK